MGISLLTEEEERQLLKNEATASAQKLRLKAMNGKTMIFVSGSFLYPSFGKALQQHLKNEIMANGVTVYMVFQADKKNDNYYQQAKDSNCFHHALFADLDCEEAGANIAAAARETDACFDCIYSCHEATQLMTAKAGELLGLPGNKVSAYEIARDKYATRKALENANLNTLKACQIFSIKDVEKAQEVVGFPMIIKPTVGMGSSGVYKVESHDELVTTVARLLDDIQNDWALAQNKIGEQAPILAETCVIPETFGPDSLVTEFDVDCLFWNGECVYANVIDNWVPQAPYYQDRGFHAPSLTSKEIQQEMINYCIACVKAMGFERGNFHTECWYTKSGPILIEVNPRVGGGSVSETHEHVWGTSPQLNMCLATLNIPVNPPRSLTPNCSYGFMLVNATKTGKLTNDTEFVKPAEGCDCCTACEAFVKEGTEVRGLDTGVPCWLAQCDFETKAPTLDLIKEMEKVMTQMAQIASKHTDSTATTTTEIASN